MFELSPGLPLPANSTLRTGLIQHDPAKCPPSASSCNYLFSLYYAGDASQKPLVTSIKVNSYLAQSQTVQLDEAYKNIMPMGRYFYYQLMPGKSG
jgi:hypothetical protein